LPELAGAARAAARRVAEALARACARALGEAVAGVVLHGSLTLGDYLPGRSDLDLLVVVDAPPSDAQVAALVEAMASRRAKAPGPVDLRLVTRQVAGSPTRRRRWRPTCGAPPGPGCGWRSAGTPGSATWRWSCRSAARTAAAC
jgi:predicted nucleotidyltransferase